MLYIKGKEECEITSVEDMIQSSAEDAFEKAYKKYVPKQVRDFIDNIDEI